MLLFVKRPNHSLRTRTVTSRKEVSEDGNRCRHWKKKVAGYRCIILSSCVVGEEETNKQEGCHFPPLRHEKAIIMRVTTTNSNSTNNNTTTRTTAAAPSTQT